MQLCDGDVRDLCWAVFSSSLLQPGVAPRGPEFLRLLEKDEALALLCSNRADAIHFLRRGACVCYV